MAGFRFREGLEEVASPSLKDSRAPEASTPEYSLKTIRLELPSEPDHVTVTVAEEPPVQFSLYQMATRLLEPASF